MKKKIVEINLKNGFHIRPATKFVKEAKNFVSDIELEFKNKKVNAKSLLKIQTLGITKGSKVILYVSGEDEDIAIKHMYNFILKLKE